MTPAEVLRILQTIRYSPRAGRPVGISWIARQSGYTHVAVFRAIRLGFITPRMAHRLSPVLARVQLGVVKEQQGNIAPTLGQFGAGTGRLPVGRALPRGARPGVPSRKPKVAIRSG